LLNNERGRNTMPTCYYCLQEGHLASHCPLRAQERTTEAIEKLGHQSLQSIDKIVSVQRDVAERIVDIGSEIGGEIGSAIYELADAFRFAHAEEMWYAEKQLEVLTGIHDMTKNRRATEADELYRQGRYSLSVGRLDDALISFKDAVELYKGDYRVRIAMGHTYIGKDDLPNALECFSAAYDYARTNYYKSFALLLIARAKYCMGKIEEATKDAKRAVELSPDYAEAHYQYAVLRSSKVAEEIKMSDQEIAIIIRSLRKAIERDKNYFVKAKIDKNFDSIRSEVDVLLKEILQEKKVKAEQAILKAESKIHIMEKWFNGEWCDENSLKDYTLACKVIREAKGMFETGSYFGYLGAIQSVQNAGEKLAIAQNSIREDLSSSKKMLEWSNNELAQTYEETKNVNKKRTEDINGSFLRFIGSICVGILIYWLYLDLGRFHRGYTPSFFEGLYFVLGSLFMVIGTPVVVLASLYFAIQTISLLLSDSKEIKNSLEKLRGRQQKCRKQIQLLEQRIQLAKESIV